MNKTELITAVAESTGVSRKDAEKVVGATFTAIAVAMTRGERVQISGFGTFETKHRQARVGRNPATRQAVEIPATDVPAFKPAQALKDAVMK